MENWSRDIGYKEKSKRKDLTILREMFVLILVENSV